MDRKEQLRMERTRTGFTELHGECTKGHRERQFSIENKKLKIEQDFTEIPDIHTP